MKEETTSAPPSPAIPLLAYEALKVAVAEAIAQHKRMGQPIVVLKEGRIVSIPPDQIRVQDPQDSYRPMDSQT